MDTQKQRIVEIIESKRDEFISLADAIWETPETRFDVPNSVRSMYHVLEREGFSIKKGIADMECSFEASFGSGGPVIGILAEYDALGNLSQVADLAEPKPLISDGNGHGCGHNLLGAGCLAAAVAIKELMREHELDGTVILFGCPAEESGYGKAFMARAGVFDTLDLALTWHPMDMNSAWSMSTLAVFQIYYKFTGISSHAAAAPEQGRSALDAAELMNVGVQFLREHITDQARVHYAFIDAGGPSANVVQPSACLHYFIRAPKVDQAREIYDRVNDIAEGAALMTGTRVERVFDSACYNFLPSRPLTISMHENMVAYGSLGLTSQDQRYAKRFFDTVPDEAKKRLVARAKAADPKLSDEQALHFASLPISELIQPLVFSDATFGSTDVGDVSWICPTAQVMVGCEPQGTAPHTWQWAANGKSDVAHKGMLAAAKIIATTAYDAMTQPDLVESAKRDLQELRCGASYTPLIPAEVDPR